MTDVATGILHTPTPEAHASNGAGATPDAPAPTVIDGAAARVAQRTAALEKARKASAANRTAKAEKRKRGRPRKDASAAPAPSVTDDPISAAAKKALLDSPVTSAKDLAQLFATVETSLSAVAPIAGAKGVFLVKALQWSDGAGSPSPQATMAANFMWPWLHKQDVFGKLAASADGLMFAAGCTVLLSPLLSTIAQLFVRRPHLVAEAPGATQPPGPDVKPAAQPSHPLAVVPQS